MGDRANIYLEMPTSYGPGARKQGVYLYTHGGGYEWPEALRQALVTGEGRWDDEPYIARIITTEVFSDLVGQTTGGGLSPCLTDNEHPIIICDVKDKTVSFAKAGEEKARSKRYGKMSWREFVTQPQAGYPSR